jgi:hypothetical protein
MEERLYLFVGQHGEELCSNMCPKRVIDYIIKTFKGRERNGRDLLIYNLNNYQQKKDIFGWYTNMTSSDYGEYDGYDLNEDDIVQLPKGTIEALTGKLLSFENEPIVLEFNE